MSTIFTYKYPKSAEYDGIILAVAHEQFKQMGAEEIRKFGKAEHVLYDLKYVLTQQESDIRL
jgi:UDP-N-acetyl-D-galactosamine dehydrogenase